MLFLPHLHLLRFIAAVAEAGSSQQAAAQLHVAQSSVARAVARLEQVLTVALFERAARGMLPTPQGRQLAVRAARALQQFAAADQHRNRRTQPEAWHTSPLARGIGLRHIQALQALAHGGSESAAAAALGISQSAVHQSLAQLEHMAGAALFIRSRNGLKLDDSGEAVLQAARLALAELRQADDEWHTAQGPLQGRLVVGTLPFSTAMLLPPAVEQVLAREPGVQLTIIDGTFDALVQQLRRAEVDFIIGALRDQPPADDVAQEVLFDDELAVVVRGGHPLALKRRLAWSHLRNAPWVLPMPNTPAEAALRHILQAAKLPFPAEQLRANSALMMQAMLANSDRLALMAPRQVAREIKAGLLAQLRLPTAYTERRIGLMRRRNYLPTPAASALLEAFDDISRILQGPHSKPIQ
ncbi:LysR family transcriptional regulator [Variovorax sp. HJSM1_2]|uniref:LysR family transcriptional regulator n=1 Tax=Variovorax sp. HJSM1_2 TaxID=3366263 RepID=UPI003BED03EA